MLKITGVQEFKQGKLVVDEYVPFVFWANRELLPSPYIWRVGNFITSLMELTIDPQSKAILGVTLTLYNETLQRDLPLTYLTAEILTGLPVVDFSQACHDETLDFRLVKCGNFFVVLLDEKLHPDRCFRVNRVGFFVTRDELCGIGFFDLNPTEIDKLGYVFQK